MGTVVKVHSEHGHGSGVHIGGGIVITAAHVITNGVKNVRFQDGASYAATVLWSNTAYDIAAIRFDNVDRPTSSLDCRAPKDGEFVAARGNPAELEFVTTRGYVAGNVRAINGFWTEAIVVDISGAGGLSGGPIFDEADHVVGIIAGMQLSQVGGEAFKSTTATGLMMAVPASAICMMMGRV